MPEPVRVRIERGIHGPHPRHQHDRVVDPLRARDDLLAAHEGVVGARQVRLGWEGRVGVEGPDGERVVREDVEVGGVALEDEFAEGFFVRGAVGSGKEKGD